MAWCGIGYEEKHIAQSYACLKQVNVDLAKRLITYDNLNIPIYVTEVQPML